MRKLVNLSFVVLLSLISITVSAQSNTLYGTDVCPLKVGAEIPSATVYSKKGKEVDLKEMSSSQPTVIIFFRGGWCPYCTRHLSEIQEVKDEIKALGFQTIAVTPDDYKAFDKTVKKTKADYELVSDKDANAIKAFGLAWKVEDSMYEKYRDSYKVDLEKWGDSKHHLLPVPAVYIVKDGIVQYQYVNPKYSTRLSADVLLSMLKSLKED